MITRKALLVGAPGGVFNDFLPGVFPDLQNMKAFLLSPQGGAWKKEEITMLYNPGKKKLLQAVKAMQADYTLTFFSGHGFPDHFDRRFISLTNGECTTDVKLLNSSVRQLVLVDDCRKFIPTGISSPYPQVRMHAGERELNRARAMYDRWIHMSNHGKMILHSTNSERFAYDTIRGGLFTDKLLVTAHMLPVSDNFTLAGILTTVNKVRKEISKEGLIQEPEITFEEGNIYLPFAMGMPGKRYTPEQDPFQQNSI